MAEETAHSSASPPKRFDREDSSFPVLEKEYRLSVIPSVILLVGLSYGANVMLMPSIMLHIGPLSWFSFTTALIMILCFCSVLLKEVCVYVMKIDNEYCRSSIIRNPYTIIARHAGGHCFSRFVLVILLLGYIFMGLGYISLTATTLAELIPINVTYFTQIRMWALLACLVACPYTLLGTYSDLKASMYVAFGTSLIAMACVIILCLVTFQNEGIEIESFLDTKIPTLEGFFNAFGDIMFIGVGVATILPNVVVLVDSPKNYYTPILIAYFFIYIGFIIAGFVPYAIFGFRVRPSIVETLYIVWRKKDLRLGTHILIVVLQASLAAHFLLVTVLQINPAFLYLEHLLEIPLSFNRRRVLLRTSILTFMAAISFTAPFISPLLSLVGGIPLNFIAIIFPVIFYWRMFEVSRYMKVKMVVVLILAFILMVGTTYSGFLKLLESEFRQQFPTLNVLIPITY